MRKSSTLKVADVNGAPVSPEPTMELLQKFRPDLVKLLDKPIVGRGPLVSIERAQRAFGYAPSFRLGT